MDALTELIFRREDEPLLTQVSDDGDLVQPEYYVPIIPMILCNGSLGIGSGWSSTIPCYNPLDVIENIKLWLEEKPLIQFVPWYRGFTGRIETEGLKHTTYGTIARNGKHTEVTELPIGMWTDKFKDKCDDMRIDRRLVSVQNYSTPTEVNFILTPSADVELSIESLKLYSHIAETNMVLFDENNMIKKYDTTHDIFNKFCEVRYDYYDRRKKYQLAKLMAELESMKNKRRFILSVVNKSIRVMNQPEDKLISVLEKEEYTDIDDLLRIPVRNFTMDKINSLNKDIENLESKISMLKKTTIENMWLCELGELERAYRKHYKLV
jgi:DNA topoisomerase II